MPKLLATSKTLAFLFISLIQKTLDSRFIILLFLRFSSKNQLFCFFSNLVIHAIHVSTSFKINLEYVTYVMLYYVTYVMLALLQANITQGEQLRTLDQHTLYSSYRNIAAGSRLRLSPASFRFRIFLNILFSYWICRTMIWIPNPRYQDI